MQGAEGMRTTTIAFAAMAVVIATMAGSTHAPEALFVMESSVVSACQLPVATRVRWDVSPLGLELAQVEIHNLGQRPKLWVAGAATGEATSGAWADDGYTVVLKSKDGKVLASRTLTTTPCPDKDWL